MLNYLIATWVQEFMVLYINIKNGDMFFFKYFLVLQYKISYFFAKIQTSVENIWDSVTKRNMSIALVFYFTVIFFLSRHFLERIFSIQISLGLFGRYYILIYILLCVVVYYKLNLTWIRAIELSEKQKNISRTILLVLFLTLAFIIYTSIKK